MKAKILKEKIKKYKLKKGQTTVVGDSITDLPMAEEAGMFVAFSPKEKLVRERADKVIKNLRELILLL